MTRISQAHTPRKRFGQNFLTDDVVIQSITRAINPKSVDHIVEIGPGQGALTAPVIQSGCRLDAIELDRDLTTLLLASFSIHAGFTLHNADALTFDYSQLRRGSEPLRVIGNLPYNISTPLLFHLLDQKEHFSDMHFMLQKEVVDRMSAAPGTKHWGRLGVMCQYFCKVECLFDVPKDAFYPPPKVQSAIVRLIPRAGTAVNREEATALGKVTKIAFAQRRKTLRNNFKDTFDDKVFESAGIEPGARAETLSIDQLLALSRHLPVV